MDRRRQAPTPALEAAPLRCASTAWSPWLPREVEKLHARERGGQTRCSEGSKTMPEAESGSREDAGRGGFLAGLTSFLKNEEPSYFCCFLSCVVIPQISIGCHLYARLWVIWPQNLLPRFRRADHLPHWAGKYRGPHRPTVPDSPPTKLPSRLKSRTCP